MDAFTSTTLGGDMSLFSVLISFVDALPSADWSEIHQRTQNTACDLFHFIFFILFIFFITVDAHICHRESTSVDPGSVPGYNVVSSYRICSPPPLISALKLLPSGAQLHFVRCFVVIPLSGGKLFVCDDID